MPSERAILTLRQILHAIHRIEHYLIGMDYADYQEDELKRLAVERLLQHVTEGGHRLGRQAPQICPGVDWRDVRELGNEMRHDYDDLIDSEIWRTVTVDLPYIKTAVQTALERLEADAGGLL